MQSYAVAFTDSAGVVDVSGPGESKRAAVEVPVREHVSQAKRVVVVLGQQLEERFHAVVAREPLHTIVTTAARKYGK